MYVCNNARCMGAWKLRSCCHFNQSFSHSLVIGNCNIGKNPVPVKNTLSNSCIFSPKTVPEVGSSRNVNEYQTMHAGVRSQKHRCALTGQRSHGVPDSSNQFHLMGDKGVAVNYDIISSGKSCPQKCKQWSS